MKTEIIQEVVLGKKIIYQSNTYLEIFSPIDGKIFSKIPSLSSKEQIESVFKNAHDAFFKYSNTPFQIRKERLLKFSNLIKANEQKIAKTITMETAKNFKQSLSEVTRSIEYINKTIDEYEKIINNPSKNKKQNKELISYYEPLGVVLSISPFNYPLNLLITKLAPALISGNVLVFKPATQGSTTGAIISTLLYEAGFNDGEISCIIGKGSEIGDYIINNKNIDMISFTGSTSIGTKIIQNNPFIPVVLEMGGKDAAIVLEDADVEVSAKSIIKGAFTFNGQRCTAIKRVLVHSNIKKQLIESLNQNLKQLRVGSSSNLNESFDITEMIDQKSLQFNLDLINQAFKRGAKSNQEIKVVENNILYPMILYDVNLKSKIATIEQFGPVLPIIEFSSIEEAIKINNMVEYGLQASIYTCNYDLANEIAKKLDVTTVNINFESSRSPDEFPFGGRKNSGKGLQGIRESILSMNKIKNVIKKVNS